MIPEVLTPSYHIVATMWLVLSLLACWTAWISKRGATSVAAALVMIVVSGAAAAIPAGTPSAQRPPPGQFQLLGFKLVPEKAIYVLLDVGRTEPVLYVIPWSVDSANKMQDRLNEGEPSGLVMRFDESGEGEILPDRESPEPKAPAEVPDWVPPAILPYL